MLRVLRVDSSPCVYFLLSGYPSISTRKDNLLLILLLLPLLLLSEFSYKAR